MRIFFLILIVLSVSACRGETPPSVVEPTSQPLVLEVTATRKAMTPVVVTAIATNTPRPTFTPKPVTPPSVSANQQSANPSVSADGRFIVFESYASNLVPGDDNDYCSTSNSVQTRANCPDIFLYDQEEESITLISKAPDGTSAQGASFLPSMTPDGRYILYNSLAPNLIGGERVICNSPGSPRLCLNVYLYDRETEETELISRTINGEYIADFAFGLSISDDGRYIGLASHSDTLVAEDTNTFCDNTQNGVAEENCTDVFLYDRESETMQLVSVLPDGTQANGGSFYPMVSGNGTSVAFTTDATNLTPNDTNEVIDLYRWERDTGALTLISVGLNNEIANGASVLPSISADGTKIAFESYATNLIRVDLNDRCDRNNDGFYIDNCGDVFVWDGSTAMIERVSVRSGGIQLFSDSARPFISADGEKILFISYTPLIAEEDQYRDWDIFLHERATHDTVGISIGLAGMADANADTGTWIYSGVEVPNYAISDDERYVVFGSLVDTYVERDTNTLCDVDGDARPQENCMDIFLLDRETGDITLISRADSTLATITN